MVHISKLENHRVEKVEDVLNLGDMTWVKFMGFDEKRAAPTSATEGRSEGKYMEPVGSIAIPAFVTESGEFAIKKNSKIEMCHFLPCR